jgi:hypothetical protein
VLAARFVPALRKSASREMAPVHCRPVHRHLGGYLGHLSAIQNCADRVQTLFDNRQDNQCQSQPPWSDVPRKRRTRVAENRPLSQITWRRNVARQPTQDIHCPERP